MCYNLQQQEQKIKKYLIVKGLIQPGQYRIDDNFMASGFVHPQLAAIATDEPKELQNFKWGLIPSWCKDEKQAQELGAMTLNAKAETVFEKPSFRSILTKRCILPVDGFFEWLTIGKNKYPHFIYQKSNDPFFMGCLYDTWVNKETGGVVNSLSIITTEANELLSKIHNTKKRMPLILPEDRIGNWLDLKSSKSELQQLMAPFDTNLMEAHSISKRITDRSQNPNVPEVTEPFNYPELCQQENMNLNF